MEIRISFDDEMAALLRALITPGKAVQFPGLQIVPPEPEVKVEIKAEAPPKVEAEAPPKRGRGRPRKEAAPEAAPAAPSPEERITTARMVAGSGAQYANAVRAILALMNTSRLSAIPEQYYAPFDRAMKELYEGADPDPVVAAFEKEIQQ